MELFCSVNLLQFIFIALRLDGFISWKWELVFTPSWFTFGVSLIGVLYSLLLAVVLSRSSNISSDQRRSSAQSAFGYASLVIPGLISQVTIWPTRCIRTSLLYDWFILYQILLAKKLDGDFELPYSLVCVPLLISFITLILRSLSAHGGNMCKFSMEYF